MSLFFLVESVSSMETQVCLVGKKNIENEELGKAIEVNIYGHTFPLI